MIVIPLFFLIALTPIPQQIISVSEKTSAYFTAPPDELPLLVKFYADQYGVSATLMDCIVQRESSYNPKASGDGGKSNGLVQIYQPAHRDVSVEQAQSPFFSLDFLAKNLSLDKGGMWSTYRGCAQEELIALSPRNS